MTSSMLVADVEGALTTRALAKGGQWLSPALLLAVELVLVLLWWTTPNIEIWWPTVWLATMGVGVMVALRAKREWLALSSLALTSGVGGYLYAVAVAEQFSSGIASDNLLLSLPKIAAVVAGVSGRTPASSIIRSSLGFGLTGAASLAAARRTGMVEAFDVTAFVTFVGLLGLMLVLWQARSGTRKNATAMNLAGLSEEGAKREEQSVTRMASLIHDTVLNDLHALARSPLGALSDAQLKFIQRDLKLLAGEHTLVAESSESEQDAFYSRKSNDAAITSVIAKSEANGIRITLSGNPAVLNELHAATEHELVQAIDQCLINVARHAGVSEAEVAITSAPSEVTVMITDAGRGFDTAATDSQRLGLRLSVHDRIHSLGGSVRLWSSPGAGTAILLTVPTASAEAGLA